MLKESEDLNEPIGWGEADKTPKKNVLALITDGSEEIEFTCAVDVLRRAGATVTVAKVDINPAFKSLVSVCSRGIKIHADELFDQELLQNDYDAIVMPGGGPGCEAMSKCELLIETLKKYLQDETKIVGSICANPAIVLQKHGLLEGYNKVTCYPALEEKIDKA